MERREYLAAAGSLAVIGAGGAVYSAIGRDDDAIEPVRIETIDAPGSSAGTVIVPEPGRTTVLELFATWCTDCQAMMQTLGSVHEATRDGESEATDGERLQLISVTNEPVGTTVDRETVAAWWREHGGAWPVGLDDDLALTETLDVRTVPTTVVFDERNRVVHAETGRKSTETVLEWIETG